MTTITNRQPRGVSTGGQFAATAHREPEVSLAAPDERDRIATVRQDALDRMNEARAVYEDTSMALAADHIRESYPDARYVDIEWSGPDETAEATGLYDQDWNRIGSWFDDDFGRRVSDSDTYWAALPKEEGRWSQHTAAHPTDGDNGVGALLDLNSLPSLSSLSSTKDAA